MASADDDTDEGRAGTGTGDRSQVPPANTQVFWTQRQPAPIISVCVAGGAESSTGNLDRLVESQSAGEQNQAELSARRKCADGANSSSSSSSASEATCSVEGVRKDFVNLISYNKLQCLFVGALLFALINVAVLIFEPSRFSQDESQLLRRRAQPNRRLASGYTLIGALLLLGFLLALVATLSLLDFQNETGNSVESSSSAAARLNQVVEAPIRTIRTKKSRRKRLRLIRTYVQLLGTLLAVAIFLLPTANFLYNFAPFEESKVGGEGEFEEEDATTRSETLMLSNNFAQLEEEEEDSRRLAKWTSYLLTSYCSLIGTICVVCATFVSHLIDAIEQVACSCSNQRKRVFKVAIVRLLICLPLFAVGPLCYLNFAFKSQQLQHVLLVAAFLVPLALVVGLTKQHLLAQLVGKLTFRGAERLIEAKVSLEQQRQQQETLLLSVLPAYVAEQVKRNMLKKVAGNSVDDYQQEQAQVGAGAQLPPPTPFVQQQEVGQQQFNCAPPPPAAKTVGSKSTNNKLGAPASDLIVTTSGEGGDLQTLATRGGTSGSGLNRQRGFSFVRAIAAGGGAAAARLSSTGNGETLAKQQASNGHQTATAPQMWPPVMGGGGGLYSASSHAARRGFNELYIRTYNNVSLLYGDIVGFTRLCTLLSASQLVKALNDLFSHFDRLAERHKIMRIKILGDCYYGVSGIPEFAVLGAKSRHSSGCGKAKKSASSQENHAINCVQMGLDMISYIKCLNIDRQSGFVTAAEQSGAAEPTRAATACATLTHSISACPHTPGDIEALDCQQVDGCRSAGCNSPSALPLFELNMRIGIHTGHIHSGVIGLKKWQFDVWSNDVSIAMHCESSGVAGRVQVTEATVQHLHGAFSFEPAPNAACDDFLANKAIRTYLIRERTRDHLLAAGSSSKRVASGAATSLSAAQRLKAADEDEERQQASDGKQLDDDKMRSVTIGTIREALLAGERPGANQANAYALALGHTDIFAWTLEFRDSTLERLYEKVQLPKLHFVAEQTGLFLLLVLTLQFVNFYLCTAKTIKPIRVYLLSFGILIGLLLLNNLLRLFQCKLDDQTQCGVGGGLSAGQTNRPIETTTRLSKRKRRRKWFPGLLSCCGFEQIRKQFSTSNRRASSLTTSSNFHQDAARKALAPTGSKRQRDGFSSTASLFLISTVILVQLYLVLGNFCYATEREKSDKSNSYNWQRHSVEFTRDFSREQRNKTTTSQQTARDNLSQPIGIELITAIEHRQLSLFLIVLALDLSVNLISYKFKCTLFAVLILVQLFVVLVLNPTLTSSEQANSFATCRLFGLTSAPTSGTGGQIEAALGQSSAKSRVPLAGEPLVCLSGDTLMLLFILLSFAFVRRLEYTQRVNFLWRKRLNVDHEELEYISGINKVLLENILPSHVVEHYLAQPLGAAPNKQPQAPPSEVAAESSLDALSYVRMSIGNLHRNLNCPSALASNELYHEQHENVAVMFASIPHFYEFYDESDISKQGLGCIALLNEIICDFDKLLLKNKFSRIEKIKTIGSTYMAAAGLRPCKLAWRASSASSSIVPAPQTLAGLDSLKPTRCSSSASFANLPCRREGDEAENRLGGDEAAAHKAQLLSQQKMNLICIIQFATSLVTTLNGINKHSFQVFKLRVGVNTGPVIAGIIGAQRPFYDIWGDCVNIASRMESLGEIGRIQVEERTARLLMECLCNETYLIERRGPIDVKGKGTMVTYFVDKRELAAATLPQPVGGSIQQPQQVVCGLSARVVAASAAASDEPERAAR